MLKLLHNVLHPHPAASIKQSWSPLFQSFSEIVLLVDQYLNIYEYNVAWINFIHIDHSDRTLIPQQDFSHWVYPEDVYYFKHLLNHPQNSQYRLRLMDGKNNLHWFEVSANYIQHDPKHNKMYWCLICSNQTERIKEQYLQVAQQRSLNDLLKRLPIMLYRSRNDRDWTMEYVSEGCEKITGYAAHQLLNTPLYGNIIHPDDEAEVWEVSQTAIRARTLFYLDYRLIRANQDILNVQEIGQGLYSESDMVLGVEGVIFPNAG
ncbi:MULTISPECIES: PAS domain-containing protein [unclassified Acinetobacter]|uniref:PAS domain-containing protein n=1 Tax=unclassified Acinetobacter TaxID=196816 RepID=UPI00190C3692|nr:MULTISPECIES: PAS domain-containing protein [unclassified Acinetobacter]MBK0062478.1 PAS domain-containing protein [Acinetobacter sp. S55]MBK0066282.1 PAS domain-containing protein [Acinetobacter sp. S54]